MNARNSISDFNIGDSVTVQSANKPWKGEVVSRVEGSRTLLSVKDIERGKGWDEATQSYKGVKVLNGWYRGCNYDYEKVHNIHIQKLSINQ